MQNAITAGMMPCSLLQVVGVAHSLRSLRIVWCKSRVMSSQQFICACDKQASSRPSPWKANVLNKHDCHSMSETGSPTIPSKEFRFRVLQLKKQFRARERITMDIGRTFEVMLRAGAACLLERKTVQTILRNIDYEEVRLDRRPNAL